MITKSDIEKPRSPRGLRKFVCCCREKAKAVTSERHAAMQKKGIYKEFFDELIPLSIFALKVSRGYGNCHVYSPGEDIERLCQFIQKTCLEKAEKDYCNYT